MNLTSVVRHLFAILAFTTAVAQGHAQSIVVTDENRVRYANGAAPSFFPNSIVPSAQVGVSESLTYRIYNESPVPLTITNIQTLGPSAITTGYDPPASTTVEPFGSTFATLRARADVAGTYDIQVTITSNASNAPTFVLNVRMTAAESLIAQPDLDMKFFTNIASKFNAKRRIINLKITGIASNLGTVATTGDMVLVYRTSKRYLDDTASFLGTVSVKKLKLPKPGKPPKTKKVKFKGVTEISESTVYLVLLPGGDDADGSNNVASMFYRLAVD